MTTSAENVSLDVVRPRRAHIWAADPDGHYVDPYWVSEALFREEQFYGDIHDPCAGFGHIVSSARAAGYIATASDIVDREFPDTKIEDFLKTTEWRSNVVTNPPFNHAALFVKHAVKVVPCGKVAVLFPTRRLNAAHKWLPSLPLVQVRYITPRPSMPSGAAWKDMQRHGKEPSGGTVDYCWLVFDNCPLTAPEGPARISWLHREQRHTVRSTPWFSSL